jgi:transforming growth factor-beta-induced protein
MRSVRNRSSARTHRRGIAAVAALLALTVGLAACGSEETTEDATAVVEETATTDAEAVDTTAVAATGKDIIETAVAAGSFTTLATLLTDAGLIETLKGPGPFTVFAPTDDAFKAVPKETLDALAADPAALSRVLTYHVVAGKVMAADIKPGAVASVAGPDITLAVADGKVTVNDATVTTADVTASNGVIHVIDKVILPPAEGAAAPAETVVTEAPATTAATVAAADPASGGADIVDTAVAAGSFAILTDLLTKAGLVETLKGEGPFTVFAPTDAAFEGVSPEDLEAINSDPELLKKVLTYHVVPGKVMAADIKPGDVVTVEGTTIALTVADGKVMVNDAEVLSADVAASNGVIHVIDKVLIPR